MDGVGGNAAGKGKHDYDHQNVLEQVWTVEGSLSHFEAP